MLGRNYTQRVEIYKEQSVSDGFGGYTNQNIFVRKVWAKVSTKSAGYKFQQYGLNDFKNPVLFYIRGKINLELTEKHFIKYKGRDFFVKGIENRELEDVDIIIYTDES